MDLFTQINNFITHMMDYVLGWILLLPRDLRLFMVAVMTSGLLTVVRLFCTDQNWLKRAFNDKKRLAQLLKQAKRDKDKDAKARYTATLNLIQLKSMKFEGKPLLWALVPVALLATWCFDRLAYIPPQAGPSAQPVEVKMYVPVSAISQGKVAHMLPVEGLKAETGWVQPVVKDQVPPAETLWDQGAVKVWDGLRWFYNKPVQWVVYQVSFHNTQLGELEPGVPDVQGVAVWKLKPSAEGKYDLAIVYDGREYNYELLAGGRHYSPALVMKGQLTSKVITPAAGEANVDAIQLVMTPMRLFDQVGAIDCLYLPAWIVGYLFIVIPFVPIIKRTFHIY